MSDPRTAEIAAKYIHVFNELGKLKTEGFAHMLDSADAEDMSDLGVAVDIIAGQIDRAKKDLGIR